MYMDYRGYQICVRKTKNYICCAIVINKKNIYVKECAWWDKDPLKPVTELDAHGFS